MVFAGCPGLNTPLKAVKQKENKSWQVFFCQRKCLERTICGCGVAYKVGVTSLREL